VVSGGPARGRCLAAALALLCFQAVPASELELAPPSRGWRGPAEPFRIRVPDQWPVERLQRLALEVDGVDVTSLLTREGPYAVYRPVEPLAYGSHEVRVVEYLPDGGVEELVLWEVEVRHSAAFREASAGMEADLTLSRRVAASSNLAGPAQWAAEGTLTLSGMAADGEWRATGSAGLGYNSLQPSAGERKVDLTSYMARLERKALGVSLGNLGVTGSSLISDGVSTRGVAVDFGHLDLRRVRARAFVARADSVSGFREGLGIGDEENRVVGGDFTFFPLKASPQDLVVQGTVYDGTASTGGEGTLGGESVQKGSGASLSVDGRMFKGRLRVRGEYARTRWDPDAGGSLSDSLTDDAYLVGIRYGGEFRGKTGGSWDVRLTHGRAGPYFNSLLKAGAPNDQEATQLVLAGQRGGWTAGLALLRARSNVADEATIPVAGLDSAVADAVYSFRKPWAGLVTKLSMTAGRQRSRPRRLPAGYLAGIVADDLTTSGSLSVDYSVLGATGKLAWDRATRWDYAAVSASRTDTWKLSLKRSFLKKKLTVSPTYTRSDTRELDGSGNSITDTVTVVFSLRGIPHERLSLTITPQVNRIRDPYGTDTETRTVTFGAGWRLAKGGGTGPAVTLGLSGTWQRVADRPAGTSVSGWQIFGSISVVFGR